MPAGIHWLLCPPGRTSDVLTSLFLMNACRNPFVFMPFMSHVWCPSRPLFSWMPAGIHWTLCPSGLTSDVLKGMFFNECLQDFVYMPFRSHSECLKGRFLINACRNSQESISFYALQVALLMSLKALFDECLQEFLGLYALQVSLMMSLKACVFMSACRNSLQ